MSSSIVRGPFWLGRGSVFPPPELADENGLLAVGGDLEIGRLLTAYRSGIFPWPLGDEDAPLLWFSPDPRFVLYPSEIHVSRSLRKTLRSGRFEVRVDSAFPEVIRNCSGMRHPRRQETWISDAMVEAYTELWRLGYAHSVEAFEDGRLAGGLYGVALGRAFFGESMFHRARDASKVAFVVLAERLRERGFHLVDCQQETAHLAHFGARGIPRSRFLAELAVAVREPAAFPAPWAGGAWRTKLPDRS